MRSLTFSEFRARMFTLWLFGISRDRWAKSAV